MGTIVLTGATGGLASVYARRLAATRPDDHLVLFVRNPETVTAGLLPAPSQLVHHVPLDMSSIDGTRKAAEYIASRVPFELPRITALVCSAAVQITSADQPRKTADGYEETVAVNHLAHYVLIRELLPRMAQGGRIIIVGSEGHRSDYKYFPWPASYEPLAKQLVAEEENPKDAYKNGMHRYGNSKLDQIMTGHELFRRVNAHYHVLMIDPGSMSTGLARSLPTLKRIVFGWALRRTWLLSWMDPGVHAMLPETSAEMLLKLTTEESYLGQESLTPNGAPYWFNDQLIESYDATKDEEACGELWRDTARLLGYPEDLQLERSQTR